MVQGDQPRRDDGDYLNVGLDKPLIGRVLVVDDKQSMLKIVSHILKAMGVGEVRTCLHAHEAFRLLHQVDVDLLLSDVEMEPVSGLKLLEAVRSTVRLRRLPVVMMTASLSSDHVSRAVSSLADGYILKPFSSQQLKECLLAAIAHAQTSRR
jgi:two-component system chemotaxis response regulator CheY